MMLKVALITSKKKDIKFFFQTAGIDLSTISLASYIEQQSPDVELLVADELDDIIRFKADVVGISATSENYPMAVSMALICREKLKCAIFIGGAHITTCPESLDRAFDAGVVGEGEETFLDIIRMHIGNDSVSAGDLSKVQGLVVHGKNGPLLTQARPAIKDLGILPLPNRKRWVENIGMAYVMTTRGCPYRCYFCAACKVWGGSVRSFPVEHVLADVAGIVKDFKPKAIRFFDDVFTLNRERINSITKGLIDSGLSRDCAYLCWTRADLIDREYIDALKRANFIHVSFGVESASEKIMRKLKGEGFDLGHVQTAIDMLHDAGIFVGCTFIIGTPGETARDLDATYSFIEKNMNKLMDVEINPLIPFPSTPLWEYAEKRKFVSRQMDWSLLCDNGFLPLFDFDRYVYLNEAMSRKKFLQYVEKFNELYKAIVSRPENIEFMNRTFPPDVFPARLKRFS